MLLKRLPAVLFMTVFSVVMLNRGEVRADFGTGTLTFDEASYTLYKWSDVQSWAGGSLAETLIATSALAISDDQEIPLDYAFRVTTSSGDNVYMRFGFDRTAGNSTGTVGSLDSGDTPAVIEATYAAGSNLNKKPNGDTGATIFGGPFSGASDANDVFAYTSDSNPSEKTDFVASGYEDQAGNYFVGARKNYNGGTNIGTGTESNASTDEEKWTSFIIDYAYESGTTVNAATGEIWDIDGGTSNAEQFEVTATLASHPDEGVTSPLGNNSDLDAKPWAWSFSNTDSSITQIKFTRKSGTVNGTTFKNFFPLAFNNFNPTSAIGYFTPEPSSLLAFGGIFSLAVLRRRRRSASA